MVAITFEQICNIAVIKVFGKVSADEVIAAIQNNYYKVKHHILWDLTCADLSAITSDDFKIILENARINRPYFTGGKTAYVSTTDSNYGMTRMFSILAEISGIPYSYKAFLTPEEAFTWLHLQTNY